MISAQTRNIYAPDYRHTCNFSPCRVSINQSPNTGSVNVYGAFHSQYPLVSRSVSKEQKCVLLPFLLVSYRSIWCYVLRLILSSREPAHSRHREMLDSAILWWVALRRYHANQIGAIVQIIWNIYIMVPKLLSFVLYTEHTMAECVHANTVWVCCVSFGNTWYGSRCSSS
jgi:hypothetical protein